jgi:hypothetical protein
VTFNRVKNIYNSLNIVQEKIPPPPRSTFLPSGARPARANHGPRDKMMICEHGPLSLRKLLLINNIRTFYRDFRAPLSIPGPRYFAPPPFTGLGLEGGNKNLFLMIIKCIRTSEGDRGIKLQFPLWGRYGCFLE